MRSSKRPRSFPLLLLAIATTACLAVGSAFATQAIAEQEKLKCRVCHTKKGSELLTDKGKYFELKRTLEDFDLVIHVYKKCTACHALEPGNKTLTPKGEMLKSEGVTMEHFGKTELKP